MSGGDVVMASKISPSIMCALKAETMGKAEKGN
jgi:hypothetical protein